MAETDAAPKAVRDPESFRDALDAWMKKQRPEAPDLHVHDVDMPRATGFSNASINSELMFSGGSYVAFSCPRHSTNGLGAAAPARFCHRSLASAEDELL